MAKAVHPHLIITVVVRSVIAAAAAGVRSSGDSP